MQTISEKEWYLLLRKKVAKLESVLERTEYVTDEMGWNAYKSVKQTLDSTKALYYDVDKGVNYTTLNEKYGKK